MFKFFDKTSKEEKILRLLYKKKNKWVSALDLVLYAKTLHHTNLIMRLRKHWNIENKTEWKWRTKYSYYKLILN